MSFFIRKSIFLIAGALSLFLFSIFFIPEFIVEKNELPEGLKRKLEVADVIICGDSRADRQLDPGIIKSKTGLNVINIASTSQDLYTWSESLALADVKGKIIVISASFFQINDAANDFAFFNLNTFADMDFEDRIEMYKTDYVDLILMQTKLAYSSILGRTHKSDFGNNLRSVNEGYMSKECGYFTINQDWFDKHFWYQSPEIGGIKQKFLRKAIANLASLEGCKIMIYNGPVSDSFAKAASLNGVLDLEKQYDAIMHELCETHRIRFVSFLNDATFRNDQLYYDPQHLCSEGAHMFSNKIANFLVSIHK